MLPPLVETRQAGKPIAFVRKGVSPVVARFMSFPMAFILMGHTGVLSTSGLARKVKGNTIIESNWGTFAPRSAQENASRALGWCARLASWAATTGIE